MDAFSFLLKEMQNLSGHMVMEFTCPEVSISTGEMFSTLIITIDDFKYIIPRRTYEDFPATTLLSFRDAYMQHIARKSVSRIGECE